MPDVRHFETIDDIDREAWDALAPGSRFYQSHAWLRGQERPEFATPGYLTVEADGQLLAGTPYYDFPSENAPPCRTCPRATPCSDSVPVPATTTSFCCRRTPERQRRHSTPWSPVPPRAAALGCDALLFDFLTTDSLRLLAGRFGVRAQLRAAEAVVHNDGGTFESYRELLGRNVRKREYEIRRFTDSGLRVETAPLSACVDEFAPLVAQTMDRYNASSTSRRSTRSSRSRRTAWTT